MALGGAAELTFRARMLRVRGLNTALPVLNVLGAVIALFSLTMLLPLAVAFFYGDAALYAYDGAAIITLVSGALIWALTRWARRELQTRDGYLLVALVWAVLPAFAALPFLFYMPQMSFTDAYFEAMAGLSTTGATVLSGLDSLPPSINIWRAFMQWLGGMGIIVLAIAILPLLRIGGRQLYRAETPGPMKDVKLTPRIAETAKGLWFVYALLTVACILALRLAGMTWFDSVIHGFTTLSLGGFSSHDASFGHFDSLAIESVTVAFMLIGGINFSAHFVALRRRSLAVYGEDPEAPWFIVVILASCVLIGLFLWQHQVFPDVPTAMRYATFNVVSVATTTGFSSIDYNLWPVFAPLWMLFLANTMSSSRSTGGGIKMLRTQLLAMQGWREMVKLLHPNAQVPVKIAGTVVPNTVIFAVLAFMSLYGGSVAFLTLVMVATGLDLVTAFSAVVASVSCTGPALGSVGPAATYAHFTDFQTWVCAFGMLIGRLELFTVFVLFTPAFWRK